jgi:hypothetical protein
MTPARAQLEALEPLAVAATIQLIEEHFANPYNKLDNNTNLDQKTALFSIAISLRRIADHLTNK